MYECNIAVEHDFNIICIFNQISLQLCFIQTDFCSNMFVMHMLLLIKTNCSIFVCIKTQYVQIYKIKLQMH